MKLQKNAKDFSGMKIGAITVIEPIKRENGRPIWRCLCECGKEVKFSSQKLRLNYSLKVLSCGCKDMSDGQINARTIYEVYKRNAKKRHLNFELSFEDFLDLTSQNCIYCGTPPQNKIYKRKSDLPYLYSGIDRVNNLIGYVKENCVPCCHQCNWSKLNLSREQFFSWIKRVYERNVL